MSWIVKQVLYSMFTWSGVSSLASGSVCLCYIQVTFVLLVSHTKRCSLSATSTCMWAPFILSVLDNVPSIWYRRNRCFKEIKAHFGIFFWVRLVHVRCNFVQRTRKQERQYTYPVTLRRFRITIVVMKLQRFALCIVELYDTVYNTKLLGVAIKYFMAYLCRRNI
jgi:hypothetical protein